MVSPGQTRAERFEGPLKPRGTNPTRCSKPPQQSEQMNEWMTNQFIFKGIRRQMFNISKKVLIIVYKKESIHVHQQL